VLMVAEAPGPAETVRTKVSLRLRLPRLKIFCKTNAP